MSKTKLIMVVDDDAAVRDVLCTFLEKKGYETAAFSDGLSAISYASRNKPDLVLLDIKMSGLDGIKTCFSLDRTLQLKQILAGASHTGIIIVTGYDSHKNIRDSFVSGAVDVVRKPFDLEDINRRINIWFEVRNIKSRLLRRWVYTDKIKWCLSGSSAGTKLSGGLTELFFQPGK